MAKVLMYAHEVSMFTQLRSLGKDMNHFIPSYVLSSIKAVLQG